MAYAIKEIFYTLQGEGAQAGRPAVFCRFAGCNLWTGRERDRASAVCRFCDTDFVGIDGVGGGRFDTPEAVAEAVMTQWPGGGEPMVVCTGGEPLLQLDEALITAFHQVGLFIAIETNGTLPVPEGIDWVCVSPKGASEVVVTTGDELKLVYPQPEAPPERFENSGFRYFFLQPMDCSPAGVVEQPTVRLATDYCLANPRWRLSLQTHKLIGIP